MRKRNDRLAIRARAARVVVGIVAAATLFGIVAVRGTAATESTARQAVLNYLDSLARPDGGYGWSDQPDSHLTPTFAVIGSYHLLKQTPPRRAELLRFVRTRHPLREENAEARQYAARLRGFSFQQIQSLGWLHESRAEFAAEVRGWAKPSPYAQSYERGGNPLFIEEMLAFTCRPLLGLSVTDLSASLLDYFEARRRANGSFNNTPATDGGDGNVLNTWAGVQALAVLNRTSEKRAETIAWLQACQLANGGFTHQPRAEIGSLDDVAYTRAAVRALAALGAAPKDRAGCIRYLQSLWNADGGFGDRPGIPSEPMATYHALDALSALDGWRELDGWQRPAKREPPPLPADLKPFTIQVEAPGQGSPVEAVELARALKIHLWGAKNANPRWIERAQQIADERRVPVRFFVSNEEYGAFMGLPGHGTYSHLSDPIAPAGVDFGAPMAGRDSTWPEFRDQRVAALQRAGGRMVWQINDNEPFARILLDDSLQRGTGYAAISTFHFWTRNMAYTLPFVFRYRHELPFVAQQDAHGSESWWWSDNLTGYRTIFLAAEPTWEAFLHAMKQNWVVAIRHDAVTQHRTRMLGGAFGVQERVRRHEAEWKWWGERADDIRRPEVSLTVVKPGDEFESAPPAQGAVVRVRCWRRNGPQGTPTEPVVEFVRLTIDGREVATQLVEIKNARDVVTDSYHQTTLSSLPAGEHEAAVTVRHVADGRLVIRDVRFTTL